MADMPTLVAQKRSKYDWETIRAGGWIFVERDDSLLNQVASIRNLAYAAGLKVKAQVATQDDALGYLITLKT